MNDGASRDHPKALVMIQQQQQQQTARVVTGTNILSIQYEYRLCDKLVAEDARGTLLTPLLFVH